MSPISVSAQSHFKALLGPERKSKLQQRGREGSSDIAPISRNSLISLWNALQWGTTSRAHHESLAIATLQNMDTEPFDDVYSESIYEAQNALCDLYQKMQTLIARIAKTSITAIPAAFIFLPDQKLPTPGFRWAPRFWLYSKGQNLPGSLLIKGKIAHCRTTTSWSITLGSGFTLYTIMDIESVRLFPSISQSKSR